MASLGVYSGSGTPYDFIGRIKEQGRITIPSEIRELEGYEIGDYVKVKIWMHKKGGIDGN